MCNCWQGFKSLQNLMAVICPTRPPSWCQRRQSREPRLMPLKHLPLSLGWCQTRPDGDQHSGTLGSPSPCCQGRTHMQQQKATAAHPIHRDTHDSLVGNQNLCLCLVGTVSLTSDVRAQMRGKPAHSFFFFFPLLRQHLASGFSH